MGSIPTLATAVSSNGRTRDFGPRYVGSTPTIATRGIFQLEPDTYDMFHYVYCIENLINGKVYVGKHSTDDLEDGYMGSGTRIRHAIAKHGLENFRRYILQEFETSEEALEFEKLLVTEEFVSDENTYNLNIGGAGGFLAANQFWADHPDKRHAFAVAGGKAVWNNPDFRKRKSVEVSKCNKDRHALGLFDYSKLNWTGRRHKEETKRKIGATNSVHQQGEGNSQFGTCWVHNLAELRNTKINKNDLDAYLKLGWVKGRKMKW